MRTDEKLTLDSIKSSPKMTEQYFRPSDFLSKEERLALKEANASRGKIHRPYNNVDAFEAELIARLGWDAFKAYQRGGYTDENGQFQRLKLTQFARWIAAERARDALDRYSIECVIVSANAGANNPNKHGKAPKSLRQALDIVKAEYKRAKGAQ